MRMWEHFVMGGWAMWFILLFGVLTVGAAARFAWRGEHQLSQFIRWMTLTTLASSFLGWGTAMIKVLSYVVHQATPDERWLILVEGTMEALNVPTFGLLFMVLACLLLAVGYRRFPTPNPSSRAV
ncbi:MAG TPA: hypothetical protein VK550_34910 [Polyangiaceae bacterium]|nr:hypothetical protein [Polyangiaceae bacterium]